MTSSRITELGQISLVTPQARLFGPSNIYIIAAFTHLNPQSNRFSDGMCVPRKRAIAEPGSRGAVQGPALNS